MNPEKKSLRRHKYREGRKWCHRGQREENFQEKLVNRPVAENSHKIRPEKSSLDLTVRK